MLPYLRIHINGLESFLIPFQIRDSIRKDKATPDYEMLEKLEEQVERLQYQLEESNFVFGLGKTSVKQQRIIDLLVLSLTEEELFASYKEMDYLLDAIDDIIKISKYPAEEVTITPIHTEEMLKTFLTAGKEVEEKTGMVP